MNNKIEIKEEVTILHFDEIPILFIGKNYKSDIVIGSLIFEDYDENTVKYFHSIIHPKLAIKFLKGKISYLDVLHKAAYLSIVTKDYNDNILNVEGKKLSEIDASFLPLPSSFCPDVDNRIVFKLEELIEKPMLNAVNSI